MKNKTRFSLLALVTLFLLGGCVASGGGGKPVKNQIQSVVMTSGSGSVAPRYRRSTWMRLDNDLNLKQVVKDYQDVTLSSQSVKLTQAQFDKVTEAVAPLNLAQLKSIEHPPTVGGGSKTLTIKTSTGEYKFRSDYKRNYPPVIARLSYDIQQLMLGK